MNIPCETCAHVGVCKYESDLKDFWKHVNSITSPNEVFSLNIACEHRKVIPNWRREFEFYYNEEDSSVKPVVNPCPNETAHNWIDFGEVTD